MESANKKIFGKKTPRRAKAAKSTSGRKAIGLEEKIEEARKVYRSLSNPGLLWQND